eukprot:g2260.t1
MSSWLFYGSEGTSSSRSESSSPELSASEALQCLFEAAKVGGHPGAVNKLVSEYKVNLSETTSDGKTALEIAVLHNNVDTVRALLRAGSPISKINFDNRSEIFNVFSSEALQQVGLGDAKRLEEILQAGLSPTMRDGTKDNGTLLHWAASFSKINIAQLLLKRGGKSILNLINQNGASALHEAAVTGNKEMITFLVENGIDVDLKVYNGKYKGKTALQIAKEKYGKKLGFSEADVGGGSPGVLLDVDANENKYESIDESIGGQFEKNVTPSKRFFPKNTVKEKEIAFSNLQQQPTHLDWCCRGIDILAGEMFEVPVVVNSNILQQNQNVHLNWKFSTEGCFVAFGIAMKKNGSSSTQTLVPLKWSGADVGGGSLLLETAGVVYIIFDNTNSWWSTATLDYEISLTVSKTFQNSGDFLLMENSKSCKKEKVKNFLLSEMERKEVNQDCSSVIEEMSSVRLQYETRQRLKESALQRVENNERKVRELQLLLCAAEAKLQDAKTDVVNADKALLKHTGALNKMLLQNIGVNAGKTILHFLAVDDFERLKCSTKNWKKIFF